MYYYVYSICIQLRHLGSTFLHLDFYRNPKLHPPFCWKEKVLILFFFSPCWKPCCNQAGEIRGSERSSSLKIWVSKRCVFSTGTKETRTQRWSQEQGKMEEILGEGEVWGWDKDTRQPRVTELFSHISDVRLEMSFLFSAAQQRQQKLTIHPPN